MLGTDRLAELLAAAAKADRALMRALSLELAAKGGGLDTEIDKQIARLDAAKGRLDAPRAAALARELEGLLASIVSGVGEADPAAGLSRLLDFMGLAGPILDRRSYEANVLVEVFLSAQDAAAPLLARVPPGAARDDFVKRIHGLCVADGVGLFWPLIGQAAGVLEPEGRAQLRRLIEADLAQIGPQPARFSLNWGPFVRSIRALCDLADAEGDVDAFIAAQNRLGPRLASTADIAARLIAGGRGDEALQWLQTDGPDHRNAVPMLEALRIEALEATGRLKEAQAARWALFRSELSIPMLRAYLARLPDFEDVEYEEAALDWVQAHPKALDALAFLTDWPDRRRAGALARKRLKSLDGETYEILAPAADALAGKDPLAATLLYRQMISDTLIARRSGRYGHAARHLAECSGLAASIADWEDWPDHDAYVARLRANHGRQASFWSRVDDL
jgi:hypothetical protein